jgi:hypothetical protein
VLCCFIAVWNKKQDQPPPLYPPIQLPAPLHITEDDAFEIGKMRDLTFRWQTSCFYLAKKTSQVKDVERFSDRYRTPPTSNALDDLFASENMQQYMPDELLEPALVGKKPRLGLSLDQLVKQSQEDGFSHLEANERRGGDDGEGGERAGRGVEDEEFAEDVVEEDLDDDYAVNYYDSGGEESDGDAEPTF